MNAIEILAGCLRDGINLSVTDDRNLAFEGESYTLSFWLPHLRKHKPEVIEALSPSVKCCQDCIHFSSPGLSDGYCGQRQDLPPAYGINHPLRKLPADGGAGCHEYSPTDYVLFQKEYSK